jgi:hypothetical protein
LILIDGFAGVGNYFRFASGLPDILGYTKVQQNATKRDAGKTSKNLKSSGALLRRIAQSATWDRQPHFKIKENEM